MEILQGIWVWLQGEGAVIATGITIFSVFSAIFYKVKFSTVKADNGGVAGGRDVLIGDSAIASLKEKPKK